MSVTHVSRRESRVTNMSCHKGCHKTPTRPDPTRPITTTGLAFSSMTSGCWVRVMDGRFAASNRGQR